MQVFRCWRGNGRGCYGGHHGPDNSSPVHLQMPGKLSGINHAHVVADRFPQAGTIVPSDRLILEDGNLPASFEFFQKPYSFVAIIHRLHTLS